MNQSLQTWLLNGLTILFVAAMVYVPVGAIVTGIVALFSSTTRARIASQPIQHLIWLWGAIGIIAGLIILGPMFSPVVKGDIIAGHANDNDKAELLDLAKWSQAIIHVRVVFADSVSKSDDQIVQSVTVVKKWKNTDDFLGTTAYERASNALHPGISIPVLPVTARVKSIDYIVFCLFPIGDGIISGPIIKNFPIYAGQLWMNGHPSLSIAEAKEIVNGPTSSALAK